ncbi:anaphase-promoting complex, cyclosome, subunit 4-domain-containing protein [Schizophyllum commune]
MNGDAFSSLALIQLPSPSRILNASCCPDKDLVLLISRIGGQDRMSLWKVQGQKKWDVNVGAEASESEHIVGIAWSPDGQSIAVAHDPPRITLHSIQDGREQSSFPVECDTRLTSLWWFKDERPQKKAIIPDIFKRNGVITGSSLYTLRTLPLLDHLAEESQSLTATDLFAFQGSATKAKPKKTVHDALVNWPTLAHDPTLTSIAASPQAKTPGAEIDDVDLDNLDSILAAADEAGRIYTLLDGCFPMGAASYASPAPFTTLFMHKDPLEPLLFLHPMIVLDSRPCTDVLPTTLDIRLLRERHVRDFARLSSAARELAHYMTRLTKDMRDVWYGGESHTGARLLGPKFLSEFEKKQQEFRQYQAAGMLDLTHLLVTGKCTESLLDFLASSEHTSDRALQRWDSAVTEALTKLRDTSERRIAPACQRLHLIMEEVLGWSQLPQYALFNLDRIEVQRCLDMIGRGLIVFNWLATAAREELMRFREFISWVRHETARARNPAATELPPPTHDLLEVNNFMEHSLAGSVIDGWFIGGAPSFPPFEIGMPAQSSLTSVLARARKAASDPNFVAIGLNIERLDHRKMERNVSVLVDDIAASCSKIFATGAGAASRSSVAVRGQQDAGEAQPTPALSGHMRSAFTKERVIRREEDQGGGQVQYLAMGLCAEDRSALCVVRQPYAAGSAAPPYNFDVAVLSCTTADGTAYELLEGDFFDDQDMLIVVRTPEAVYLASVGYHDLGYQTLAVHGATSRENLALEVMGRCEAGEMAAVEMPIKKSRRLVGCRSGAVSLAVNGRPNRRVACVLDGAGTKMECIDVEGDEEDEDEEGEEEAEGQGEEEGSSSMMEGDET